MRPARIYNVFIFGPFDPTIKRLISEVKNAELIKMSPARKDCDCHGNGSEEDFVLFGICNCHGNETSTHI